MHTYTYYACAVCTQCMYTHIHTLLSPFPLLTSFIVKANTHGIHTHTPVGELLRSLLVAQSSAQVLIQYGVTNEKSRPGINAYTGRQVEAGRGK